MKKTIISLVAALLCVVLISCGIEPSFYIDTDVPTFTCVTGIEATKKANNIYEYSCKSGEGDKLIKEYTDYLKKDHGFTTVDADDGYDMITLVKGNYGVVIALYDSTTINVLPYKRAN